MGETGHLEENTYKKLKDNWNKLMDKTVDFWKLVLWRDKFITKQAKSG